MKRKNSIDVCVINEMAAQGAQVIVDYSERRYHSEIKQVARAILAGLGRLKIVLIAGPSGSGKTTTAELLRQQLEQEGVGSATVSLDDFFIDNRHLPVLKDGTPDFESVYALDLSLLHRCFQELAQQGKTCIPQFDFTLGRANGYKKICIDQSHLLLVEGLHALNPLLVPSGMRDQVFRVYISVQSEFEMDRLQVLSSRDIRLMRRMLRDYKHRNSSIERTMKLWRNVRVGERKYIAPFKNQADEVIDSIHLYEPMLYRDLLLPLLPLHPDKIYQPKIAQIRQALDLFDPLTIGNIPENSMINEFIL